MAKIDSAGVVSGIAFVVVGVILVFLSFFFVFLLIYDLPVLIMGIVILLTLRQQEAIEPIKTVRERDKKGGS